MTVLFRHYHSSNAKAEAQRNLDGRSHYVDDATLRFHKVRVLTTKVVNNGLLLALIESVELDPDNARRGYRYVVFNVFGHVICEPDPLDYCCSTRKAAEKAMWAYLNSVDAKAETLSAIAYAERHHAQEMADLRAICCAVKTQAVPAKHPADGLGEIFTSDEYNQASRS